MTPPHTVPPQVVLSRYCPHHTRTAHFKVSGREARNGFKSIVVDYKRAAADRCDRAVGRCNLAVPRSTAEQRCPMSLSGFGAAGTGLSLVVALLTVDAVWSIAIDLIGGLILPYLED